MNCALFFVNSFGHWLTALCSLFLGKGPATKSDEFSEKFNPPSFSENYVAIFFSENVRKRPYIKVQNLQYKCLD